MVARRQAGTQDDTEDYTQDDTQDDFVAIFHTLARRWSQSVAPMVTDTEGKAPKTSRKLDFIL